MSPAGELDLAAQPRFAWALGQAVRAARLVVLDLRALVFIDCSGLRVILEASRRACEDGRRVVLIRGPAQVHRLLTLAGAAQELEIVQLGTREPGPQVLLSLVDEGQVA